MKVRINGEMTELVGEARTALDVVQSFYNSPRFAGQMIAELRLDGRTVPLDSREAIFADGDVPDLVTMSRRQAFYDSGYELAGQVGLLVDVLRGIVAAFRESREAEANAAFSVATRHLRTILGNAAEIEAARRTLLSGAAGLNVLEGMGEGLPATFRSIVKAQEQGDWVLLADLLEYELIPRVEGWTGSLRERFGAPPISTS